MSYILLPLVKLGLSRSGSNSGLVESVRKESAAEDITV